MSDRKTTGPGEPEALQLTRAMKQGLQFRTLRLMTKADANLAMEALEAPIKDGRKVGLNEAQTFAWKLYCRYYLKVRKWWENRFIEADTRVYRGAATYSIPDWLVVADLNWNERHLLADVAWLQAHGERGCDKSIVGFAMELGMSIQAVESMVGRLKREGWLKTERVGDRRILIIVNKSILQVGKSPPSVLEQVSKNSLGGEQKLTDQVNKSLLGGEQKLATKKCKQPLKSSQDKELSETESTSNLQDSSKDNNDDTGATPPNLPSSSSSLRSGGEPDGSPGTPPSRLNQDKQRTTELRQGYEIVSSKTWTSEDEEGFARFEKETKGSWPISGLLALLVCSWELRGKTMVNSDGSIYRFPVSQGSRRFSRFLRHVDQIDADVASYSSEQGCGDYDFRAGSVLENINVITGSLDLQKMDDSSLDSVERRLMRLFQHEVTAEKEKDAAIKAGKFFTNEGKEIPAPSRLPWAGIRRILSAPVQFHSTSNLPQQKWIDGVVKRLRNETGKTNGVERDYETVKLLLQELKLLPEDLMEKEVTAVEQKRDPSKFYDESGNGLPDPATGDLKELFIKLRIQRLDRKKGQPDQKWLQALFKRLQKEMHQPSDSASYANIRELLEGTGWLPKEMAG